jgi:hypothetical protein
MKQNFQYWHYCSVLKSNVYNIIVSIAPFIVQYNGCIVISIVTVVQPASARPAAVACAAAGAVSLQS